MEIRTGGMSVSGQSHSLWNAQPRASSEAFLCGTNPRARNCPRCGSPKTLLSQCVLGPASAGLFFLKTEADFLEDATVGAAQHLSARRCAPMSDQARRRRRLSSITRAPCRNVMGVPSDRKRRSGTKKMPRLGRGCRGHCGVGC